MRAWAGRLRAGGVRVQLRPCASGHHRAPEAQPEAARIAQVAAHQIVEVGDLLVQRFGQAADGVGRRQFQVGVGLAIGVLHLHARLLGDVHHGGVARQAVHVERAHAGVAPVHGGTLEQRAADAASARCARPTRRTPPHGPGRCRAGWRSARRRPAPDARHRRRRPSRGRSRCCPRRPRPHGRPPTGRNGADPPRRGRGNASAVASDDALPVPALWDGGCAACAASAALRMSSSVTAPTALLSSSGFTVFPYGSGCSGQYINSRMEVDVQDLSYRLPDQHARYGQTPSCCNAKTIVVDLSV